MRDYKNSLSYLISHINIGTSSRTSIQAFYSEFGMVNPREISPTTSKKVEHVCSNSSLTLFFSWCLDFLFSLSRPRRRAPPAFTGSPLMRWLLPPMIPRQLSEPHLHACCRAEKHGANQKKKKTVKTTHLGDSSVLFRNIRNVLL